MACTRKANESRLAKRALSCKKPGTIPFFQRHLAGSGRFLYYSYVSGSPDSAPPFGREQHNIRVIGRARGIGRHENGQEGCQHLPKRLQTDVTSSPVTAV
ncbi:uncharacterized [Tachysurus ichikawai]